MSYKQVKNLALENSTKFVQENRVSQIGRYSKILLFYMVQADSEHYDLIRTVIMSANKQHITD